MLLVQPITVRHFSDPGCPWAYSASPAPGHAALALRRAARLEAHAHRADRARPAVRRSRLHPQRQARAIATSASTACRSRRSPSTTWPPRRAPAGRRRRPHAGSGARRRRLPRAAAHAVHHAARARRGRRPRHRPAPRHGLDAQAIVARIDDPAVVAPTRPTARWRAPPRARPRVPGQERRHRRPGALHRALARLRARRHAPGGRRLSVRSRPTT
jgi:hypothetical protein